MARPATKYPHPEEGNFWLGLYADSFRASSSRYVAAYSTDVLLLTYICSIYLGPFSLLFFVCSPNSIMGIYMIFLSMRIEEARKLDNILTIAVLPARVQMEKAMQIVMREIKELEGGVDIIPTKNTNLQYTIFPHLALFASDSKELCRVCGHRGTSSTYMCRCCGCNKASNAKDKKLTSTVTDPTFDPVDYKNSRSAYQYREFVKALIASDLSQKQKETQSKRFAVRILEWVRQVFFLYL